MKTRATPAAAGAHASPAAQQLDAEGRKSKRKAKKGELGDPQFAAALLEQATGAVALAVLHAGSGHALAPDAGRTPPGTSLTSTTSPAHPHGKTAARRTGTPGTDAVTDGSTTAAAGHAPKSSAVAPRTAAPERAEEGRRESAIAGAAGTSGPGEAPRGPLELPGPSAARLLPPDAPPEAAVQGAVLARAAHLTVTTPAAGEVALHLRVRDGVANVRIEGHAAPVLARAEASLSAELGTRGLQLRLDAAAPVQAASHAESLAAGAQGDRNGQPPPEDRREPAEGRPASRSATSTSSSTGRPSRPHDDGRIHVEA